MKEIICSRCGNEIESGYEVNPANSNICNTCFNEEERERDWNQHVKDMGDLGVIVD